MKKDLIKTYLICDESGCKGFANNPISNLNDIGVFAGYCIPERVFSDVRSSVNIIANKYENSEGKTHITNLTEEHQNNLRQEIFNYLLNCQGFYFFYEAIHHNGFCMHHLKNQQFLKEHKHENPRFRTSNNPQKYRLHTTLFQSLFIKNLALLIDLGFEQFEINVITDKIDSPIIKEFNNSIEQFLNISSTTEYTGYDTIDKTIRKGSISFSAEGLHDYRENLKNYNIQIVSEQDTNLVLIADILANSILYYLNEDKDNKNLNSKQSLIKHPLYKCLYAPDDEQPWINDILYKK